MHPASIPFQVTDWQHIAATKHPGETGVAYWRTLQLGNLRVRMVEYSPHYKADHWCQKGHLLFVLEGELTTELADGSLFPMRPGISYEVSDELSSHRSFTEHGAKLLIVDGTFLAAAAGE
ncbi:DHCW motif cupin fold protein [Hymenobacter sp. BT190]|uniref:DHCW motif cupin fold protein n=1 Tax=Hymenobacter sp. BT190 TaxID=2763505 RepID=UPI0016511CC8|nr:DHCW motif cupin fold protein [Hymenobacter sp. BT190]MBC6697563.1 DHCW motif cupin fold protein [Hymenobacter sp. BT190]